MGRMWIGRARARPDLTSIWSSRSTSTGSSRCCNTWWRALPGRILNPGRMLKHDVFLAILVGENAAQLDQVGDVQPPVSQRLDDLWEPSDQLGRGRAVGRHGFGQAQLFAQKQPQAGVPELRPALQALGATRKCWSVGKEEKNSGNTVRRPAGANPVRPKPQPGRSVASLAAPAATRVTMRRCANGRAARV